jgi:hypothetical protein
MTWLLLGAALLLGAILLGRWFVSADTKTVLRALRWAAAIIATVVVLLLVATGRLSFLWFALMGLLPWMMRFGLLRRIRQAARGPSPGRRSSVNTRFVAMTLDHDTGDMDGEVREGPFAGRKLSQMALDDLLSLLAEVHRSDPQGASVLEAYLDRAHGDWRDRAGGGAEDDKESGKEEGTRSSRRRSQSGMTEAEALDILDLAPGASRADIVRRHRELMKKVHPDHGGSDYLAARINAAKEYLLRPSRK